MNAAASRLVKRKHAGTAFSGEGARRYGGRWNHAGIPIVYTAGSLPLAALELMVHLEASELLSAYVAFEIEIPAADIEEIDKAGLPRDWRTHPPPDSTQWIGDLWYRAGRSAVLRVPSTVIPAESNFLLNPEHAGFGRLHIGKPAAFGFDVRLAVRGGNHGLTK